MKRRVRCVFARGSTRHGNGLSAAEAICSVPHRAASPTGCLTEHATQKAPTNMSFHWYLPRLQSIDFYRLTKSFPVAYSEWPRPDGSRFRLAVRIRARSWAWLTGRNKRSLARSFFTKKHGSRAPRDNKTHLMTDGMLHLLQRCDTLVHTPQLPQ